MTNLKQRLARLVRRLVQPASIAELVAMVPPTDVSGADEPGPATPKL